MHDAIKKIICDTGIVGIYKFHPNFILRLAFDIAKTGMLIKMASERIPRFINSKIAR